MRKKSTVFTILLVATTLFPAFSIAQIGLSLRYFQPVQNAWVLENTTDQNDQQDLLRNGYSIGIDYRFFLEGVRIEFLPELSFQQSFYRPVSEAEFSTTGLGLSVHTNFYLFDLQGDCGCPTFSKQGSFFSKGFFVQVSPGVLFQFQNIEGINNNTDINSSAIAFRLGLGAGLDIGISDRFTITPLAGIHWLPSLSWDGLGELVENSLPWQPQNTSVSQLNWNAGLRVGYRLRY